MNNLKSESEVKFMLAKLFSILITSGFARIGVVIALTAFAIMFYTGNMVRDRNKDDSRSSKYYKYNELIFIWGWRFVFIGCALCLMALFVD